MDMGRKGDGLLHYGRSCVVDLFFLLYFIIGHCWCYGDTVKFYILILYLATLLLSFIRTHSLFENHNGFSI